ncbi:MAG: sigma-70 family RNA polymerase sigma factor [Bacteroidetes bacterium]|nr:sigma-70 family RNA polymerase sigma factor [Bacteroidota bacterium]
MRQKTIFVTEAFTMTKDPHPDIRYVHALASNDHTLIKEIYDQYFPRISAMIRKNSGTESDAYDIFQEALMVIYTKSQQADFQLTSAFYSFLYGISYRLWLKELRKKHRDEVTLEDDQEFRDEYDLEDAIFLREQRKLIREKFEQLKDRCQRILNLTLKEQKSHQEVAEIMGFANANVAKKEKSKCKSRLVKMVKEDIRYQELL